MILGYYVMNWAIERCVMAVSGDIHYKIADLLN
jgi:hypothetical protein